MSTHREAHLAGVDGLEIFWQTWQPSSPPRAVVVIAHGAGEHSGRYGHVATRLVSEGYAVYASDHHGHGRSAGSRALVRRMDSAVSDLNSLVTLALEDHPDTDVFLLGHSMGGTIALGYAIDHQDRLRGLILSGPLAALPPVPAPLRMFVRAMSAVAPALPALAVDPTQVSRNSAVVSAYTEDPLVHHGKLPARTVAEIAAAVESFPTTVQAITIPTLIAYGTADGLCPPSGSLMLHHRIGAEDKTLKAYEGLYHEIFNEPEQDAVLDDVCRWVSAHLAIQPAAAPSSSRQPLK
jgi:alpha-beta hydrolase superfamily lysophospholipase